jgi:hypothetical protein
MTYHLNQNGQDAGEFPLEELRRRRAAGELTGAELVRHGELDEWRPLDQVLPPALPKFIAPPPVPPGRQPGLSHAVLALLAIAISMFLVGAVVVSVVVYQGLRMTMQHPVSRAISHVKSPALEAASRPVLISPGARTAADVQKAARAFRVRQYLEGYQLRGQRNPECDLLALQFLTNWLAENYGGTIDTNLPSLSELSARLVRDPACQDPLIWSFCAVNCPEVHESVRRWEWAVKHYEGSQHRSYPKFYATVMLGNELSQDDEEKTDRLPVLDAQALEELKAAFADGSVRPEDQDQIAELLLNDWANAFFARQAGSLYPLVQQQGKAYQWLALTLEGEYQINEAWRARGSGYRDSVSENGWKGFSEHLAAAHSCLAQAWKLRPDLPLAPTRMMTVSLGESGIEDMRLWFDRAVAAQIDYPGAWKEMRWGLRPRWFGDETSMLAFGVTALQTRRFDTDVPRMYFDSLTDLEAEMELPAGRHLYARADIWPRLQQLYEGYIAEPSLSAECRDGWRSTYAVVASLAGHYDVAQRQFAEINWQPDARNLDGWNRDLSLLPQEVAARTGPQAAQVKTAESRYDAGDITGALQIYQALSVATNTDTRSRSFVLDRLATLTLEQHLQTGKWVDFLPTDAHFTGWHASFGNFKLLPDGAVEVQSDQNGHMLYSRVRLGTEFEARGQFEVVSSTTNAFQGGLVMGIPEQNHYNWYGFRVKRNANEGDIAAFSEHWTKRQIVAPAPVDSHTNTFTFRFQDGRVTASVNGGEVFKGVPPPRQSYVTTNEFYLGIGAFNDVNTTVIRYRNLQVRRL